MSASDSEWEDEWRCISGVFINGSEPGSWELPMRHVYVYFNPSWAQRDGCFLPLALLLKGQRVQYCAKSRFFCLHATCDRLQFYPASAHLFNSSFSSLHHRIPSVFSKANTKLLLLCFSFLLLFFFSSYRIHVFQKSLHFTLPMFSISSLCLYLVSELHKNDKTLLFLGPLFRKCALKDTVLKISPLWCHKGLWHLSGTS